MDGEKEGSMNQEKIDTTEKITININTIDLGYIDLLVSEGYYSTRTDFIKTSIKMQLEKHEEETKRLIKQKENSDSQLIVGIGGMTRKDLETAISENKKMKIVHVGLFFLPKDVSLELFEQVVESIKVYGVSRCSKEIKDKYGI